MENNITGEVLPESVKKVLRNSVKNNYAHTEASLELDEFKTITEKLYNTYCAKNKDYGNSFDKSLDEFGLIAAAVRLSDKLNRVKTLIHNNPEVNDETIEDTIMDMANYCIMTAMWLRKF